MLVKVRDDLWVRACDVKEVELSPRRDLIFVRMEGGNSHPIEIGGRELPHMALDAVAKRISDASISAAVK